MNGFSPQLILFEYLKDKEVPTARPLALGPAVNYGQIGAVLLNKIALQRLSFGKRTWRPNISDSGAGQRRFAAICARNR